MPTDTYLLLAYLVNLTILSVCSGTVTMNSFHSYPECSSDWALGNDVIQTQTTRSSIECSSTCDREDYCFAVNICNLDQNLMTCELLGARGGACAGLVPRANCKYREKERQVYTSCQNGGTWTQDPPCKCMPGWAGVYCERIVRDCKEGMQSGQTGTRMSVIQPVGCIYSFTAFCAFHITTTYVLRRGRSPPGACTGDIFSPLSGWNDFKNAHGNGYTDVNGDILCDLSVGLVNLWYLLRQGTYHLHVYLQYYDAGNQPKTADVYYWNFKMTSEADGYAIQYSAISPKKGAEDGLLLSPNTPTKFCTHDHDCGNCVQSRGVAWWYTPNCDNYPLTVNSGELKWPINGQDQLLDQAVMQVWPDDYYW